MLVREDLLVTGAEITHAHLVRRFYVTMQVGPSQSGKVAGRVGTVVSEQKHRVANNVFFGIFDADIIVSGGDVLVGVVLEALLGIIGEDDKRSRCLAAR